MRKKVNSITASKLTYIQKSTLKKTCQVTLVKYVERLVQDEMKHAIICLSLYTTMSSCIAVTNRRHLDVPGYDRAGGRSLPSVVMLVVS